MTAGNCLMCGGKLKYYDSIRRIVRTKSRKSRWIIVPRYQCVGCRCIRRYLPDYIYPYKQYESEIIVGVIEGLITCETFGYEDYPCEMTMIRWKAQESQLLLCKQNTYLRNENCGLAKPISFCLYPPRLFLRNAIHNLEQPLKGDGGQ